MLWMMCANLLKLHSKLALLQIFMWALHKEQAESFYFGDPLGEMPLVNSVFEMKNQAAAEQAKTLLHRNNDDRKKAR
ncbi:hypothetical protein GCM10011328_16960 [Hafnia psychrotolerans]|uniref:Uncharacterized protein n=1 Tax=Hafnia psychrotolerans TaxID=1477018 RepID=A0ABQ1GF42_9GAMM|nr:hypothetical protein GCM10011328_16960 [Hafnia psychrotolerans]